MDKTHKAKMFFRCFSFQQKFSNLWTSLQLLSRVFRLNNDQITSDIGTRLGPIFLEQTNKTWFSRSGTTPRRNAGGGDVLVGGRFCHPHRQKISFITQNSSKVSPLLVLSILYYQFDQVHGNIFTGNWHNVAITTFCMHH